MQCNAIGCCHLKTEPTSHRRQSRSHHPCWGTRCPCRNITRVKCVKVRQCMKSPRKLWARCVPVCYILHLNTKPTAYGQYWHSWENTIMRPTNKWRRLSQRTAMTSPLAKISKTLFNKNLSHAMISIRIQVALMLRISWNIAASFGINHPS